MKLQYDLPTSIQSAYPDLLLGRSILYCIPFDLSIVGRYEDGYSVVTKDHLLIFPTNGGEPRVYPIHNFDTFESITETGDGLLIGKRKDDEPLILARFTMMHAARYKYIARALNQLLTLGRAKIISTEDDNVCPKCGRRYGRHGNVCRYCVNKTEMFKKLFSMASSKWYLFVVVTVVFITITGLRLLNPLLSQILIDDYIMPQNPNITGMLGIVGLMALVLLGMTGLAVLRGRTMARVGAEISRDLRQMVYEKIQSLSLGYINKRKTGDLMNRITDDTDRISRFMVRMAPHVINDLLTMVGVLIIMFTFNWQLALIVLIPVPVILVAVRMFRRFIHRLYHRQWRQNDRANSLLQDIISGIRVIKSFGKEKYAVEQFTYESKRLADVMVYNEKTWQTLFPALMFVMGMGSFFIMFFGGRMVLDETLRVGELVRFMQYAAMLYGPLHFISFIPRALAEMATAIERIFDVIEEEPDIMDADDPVKHNIDGVIEFDDVTFGYESYEPVLEHIDVTIQKGEMLGLVGHSGAGKSTFINLVMRLYDVDEGVIKIDGIDLRNISKEDLSRQIGVVLQETFLFSGTVLENVQYAKPDATYEEIMIACKLANAHDFILRFPDGYNTRVGERGHRVSGGERQRISIARAILSNPRILILDEATSSLDTNTEQKIQEALGRLTKDRTTIAIAHRLSTLKNANRLMVIEKGRKAELGTHEELMALGGIYHGLVTAQTRMSG